VNTSNDEHAVPFKQIRLSDGTVVYVFTENQARILAEMLEDRVWWRGAVIRAQRLAFWWGSVIGFFAGMALVWPYLTRLAQVMSKQ
jgi:hypothetical protein